MAFSDDISVTVRIDYEAFKLPPPRLSWLKTEWVGAPTKEIIPIYMEWMHTVICEVAQRINDKICYGYSTPAGQTPLVFVYYPDGNYETFNPDKHG